MKKLAVFLALCLTLTLAGCSNSVDSENGVSNINDVKEEEITLVPINIIFSPHTGNDETGNGTLDNPLETIDKAKEFASGMNISENQETVFLEYLMTVDVKLNYGSASVSSPVETINMIPFTGSVDSYYFKGEMPIQGCDTQRYGSDGSVSFSARYMLSGTDYEGQSCSIFIENNGPALDNCTPTIVTDSKALSEWHHWKLKAIVVPCDGGVKVNVFRVRD